MITLSPIYRRDGNGGVRFWQAEIEDDRWRTVAGLVDGKPVISGWTVCQAKNVGKKNERSAVEQAYTEAVAERDKKLAREYREDITLIDTVPAGAMLAKKWDDVKAVEIERLLAEGVYSQPKLDGIRALISSAGAFSREYKRHCNIAHIERALAFVFDRWPGIVLDGELYNHELKDDFNRIASVVRRQKPDLGDVEESERTIRYYMYDVQLNRPYNARFRILQEIADVLDAMFGVGNHPVVVVDTVLIENSAELDEIYSSYLEDGYEGQMIRSRWAIYEADRRSWSLLKRKTFFTDEFPLVDIVEGIGNWAGRAKAIVYDGPRAENGELPRAGIRGSQNDLERLLAEKDSYIGGEVTIRYPNRTPGGALRFPIAVDFHRGRRED